MLLRIPNDSLVMKPPPEVKEVSNIAICERENQVGDFCAFAGRRISKEGSWRGPAKATVNCLLPTVFRVSCLSGSVLIPQWSRERGMLLTWLPDSVK